MATNRMSGNLLGVKLNGQFIDCEMSCEFAFDCDLLPASPLDDGRWKSYISGIRSWNITVNAAMLMRMAGTGFNTILNAFYSGDLMAVSLTTKLQDTFPNMTISGNVRLRNGGLSASVNTLAIWNVTLEGDGAFITSINDNVQFAISTGIQDELIEDGNGNLVVSENGEFNMEQTIAVSTHGIYEANDTGQSTIEIPHGLIGTPTYFVVNPISEQAINNSYIEITADGLNLILTPIITANNNELLRYTWEAKL